MSKRVRAPVSMLVLLASFACEQGTGPTPPDVTNWVTGEAKQALDGSGHFVLAPVEIPADRPVISQERSVDLAVAFIHTVESDQGLITQLANERGGEAPRLDRLKPSARVESALSPYQTTPPEYGDATLRSRGSFYFVRFLDGVEPVVTVGVAAHATEVTIVDGKVQFPAQHGNEFLIAGDPAGSGFEKPISPEEATRIAAQATGAKIDQQPLLRRPEWVFSQFYSRWLLHLDRPVRFRRVGSNEIVESRTIYVGPALDSAAVLAISLLFPRDVQPVTQDVSASVQLRVRDGYPVWFDRVTVVP